MTTATDTRTEIETATQAWCDQRDAARYRHLRDTFGATGRGCGMSEADCFALLARLHGAAFDRLVDDDMKEHQLANA